MKNVAVKRVHYAAVARPKQKRRRRQPLVEHRGNSPDRARLSLVSVDDLRLERSKLREEFPDNQRVTKAQLARHFSFHKRLDTRPVGEVTHVAFTLGDRACYQLRLKAIRKSCRQPHDVLGRTADVQAVDDSRHAYGTWR